jgi:hypothetical protein
VSLSIPFVLAWCAVEPASTASPPSGREDPPPTDPASALPAHGVRPLARPPPDGSPPRLRPSGVAPLSVRAAGGGSTRPVVATPLGHHGRRLPPPLDPRRARLVRIDLTFGPLWRLRVADTALVTGVEAGRMHGFSGAFTTGMIVITDRDVIRAFDFPIGVGAIARARARARPLYASAGLSVGLLVHRAATEQGVIHRVDPDFRLPIRLAWTIATVGLTVALEQGYSVRSRSYERRGVEVWARHAYRIGFVLGVHSDIMAGRSTMGRRGLRRSGR